MFQNGELLAGLVTPVDEHIIQSRKRYEFTLKLPGYMPAHVPATVGRAQAKVPVHADLQPGGSLTIRSNYETRVRIPGVPGCTKLAPVVDCPLPNGTYKVRISSSRLALRRYMTIEIKNNDIVRNLSFGTIEAKAGHRFVRYGRLVRRAAFDAGTHKVKVVGEGGEKQTLTVRVSAGKRTSVP